MIEPLKYIRKTDNKVFIVSECYYNRMSNKVECIVLSGKDEYIDVNNYEKKYDFQINEKEFKRDFRKVIFYEMWICKLQAWWRSFKRRRN